MHNHSFDPVRKRDQVAPSNVFAPYDYLADDERGVDQLATAANFLIDNLIRHRLTKHAERFWSG